MTRLSLARRSRLLRLRSQKRRRRGALTVEYALCLSLMFTLIFGGLHAAWAFTLKHTLQNAAYEAARLVVVPGATAEEARQAARDLVRLAGVSAGEITIAPEDLGPEDREVSVRVELAGGADGCPMSGLFSHRSLFGECTLRTERAGL